VRRLRRRFTTFLPRRLRVVFMPLAAFLRLLLTAIFFLLPTKKLLPSLHQLHLMNVMVNHRFRKCQQKVQFFQDFLLTKQVPSRAQEDESEKIAVHSRSRWKKTSLRAQTGLASRENSEK
jgi:hypothetical protein